MHMREGLLGLAGVAAVIGLVFAGHWLRRDARPRCDRTSEAIDPLFRVRVRDGRGRERQFCCIKCAEEWLSRQDEPPQAVFVTDEISGQEVEAAAAWFVSSWVVSRPTTGCNIHSFRDRAAAEKHAAAQRGRVLEGDQRPFR